MKKIIALLLIVCCVLSFAACNRNKNKDPEPTPDPIPGPPIVETPEDELTAEELAAIAAIQAKVDASVPETAKVTVLLEAALDDLKAEYNVTYNLEGTGATVEGWYEKFNTVGGDVFADDYKTTYTVNAVVDADGNVSGVGGVAFVEAVTFDINLDSEKLSDVEVKSSYIGATVKAADTLAVLGVEIGYDARVIISVSSLGVYSISISYTSAAGNVEISATYTYYIPEEEVEE